jgi:glucose-6-phosphate dehydrogenase assembly protein OpcA
MMALQTNVADLTEKVNAIVILVPGLVANNAALQKQLGSADLDADVQAQADLVAKDVAALAALVTPAAPAAPEAPQTQPE